jgi:hypothetical protein
MLKDEASYNDVLLGRPTKFFIIQYRTSSKPTGRLRSFAKEQIAILGHEDKESP